MSFTREWFLGVANDWQFAAAYTVCAVIGIRVLGGRAHAAISSWSSASRHRDKQTTVYPSYVSYNGVMYVRLDKKGISFYTMEYILYYAAVVAIMGALEKIVEGNMGILVRLEVWGIIGALVGSVILMVIGSVIGPFVGVGVMTFQKMGNIALQVMTWMMICKELGAYLGALFGVVAAVKFAADSHDVGFWIAVLASFVPACIIFVEVGVRVSARRDAEEYGDAINKEYQALVLEDIVADRKCSEQESPLPPVVRSCTKEEYWEIHGENKFWKEDKNEV